MYLFFTEIVHFSTSLLAGWIVSRRYGYTKLVFALAILAGFLIDLDHLFDYFMAFGLNFNLVDFLSGNYYDVSDQIYLPFHAWELGVALLLIFWIVKDKLTKAILLSLALGLLFHIIGDVVSNNVGIATYSVFFRWINNFNSEAMENFW